jgi:predicted HicB family RNase H-like nuclease
MSGPPQVIFKIKGLARRRMSSPPRPPMLSKSFRISRQDWERLHSLALTDGVSFNTLTLRALSKLLEERGLPGITVD